MDINNIAEKLLLILPILIFALSGKFDVAVLLLISAQLHLINKKLGAKNGTTD